MTTKQEKTAKAHQDVCDELKNINDVLEETRSKLELTATAYAETDLALKRTKDELDRTSSALDDTRREKLQVEGHLADVQTSLEGESASLHRKIEECETLKGIRKDLETSNARFQQELQILNSNSATLTSELRSEIHSLEERLDASNNNCTIAVADREAALKQAVELAAALHAVEDVAKSAIQEKMDVLGQLEALQGPNSAEREHAMAQSSLLSNEMKSLDNASREAKVVKQSAKGVLSQVKDSSKLKSFAIDGKELSLEQMLQKQSYTTNNVVSSSDNENSYGSENVELKHTLRRLSSEVAIYKDQVMAEKEVCRQLTAKYSVLAEDKRALEIDCSRIKSDLVSSRSEVGYMKQRCDELARTIAEKTAQQESALRTAAFQAGVVKDTLAEIDWLKSNFQRGEKALETASAQLQAANSELFELRSSLGSVKASLDSALAELQLKNSKLESFLSENNDLVNRAEALSKQVNHLQSSESRLSSELGERNAYITAVEKDLNDTKAYLQDKDAVGQRLLEEHRAIVEELEKLRVLLATEASANSQLRQSLDDSKVDRIKLEERSNQLSSSLEEMEAKCMQWASANEETVQKLVVAEVERTDLRGRFEQCLESITELKGALSKSEEALLAERDTLRERIQTCVDMHLVIEEKETLISAMKQEIEGLTSDNVSYKSKNSTLLNDIEVLVTFNKGKDSEMNCLKSTVILCGTAIEV